MYTVTYCNDEIVVIVVHQSNDNWDTNDMMGFSIRLSNEHMIWATYINKWHTLLADRAPGMVVRSSNDAADRFMMMIWSRSRRCYKVAKMWFMSSSIAKKMTQMSMSQMCASRSMTSMWWRWYSFIKIKSLNPPSLSAKRGGRERGATTHQGHMISSNASRQISFKLLSLRYSYH